jgi:hypothetical protein
MRSEHSRPTFIKKFTSHPEFINGEKRSRDFLLCTRAPAKLINQQPRDKAAAAATSYQSRLPPGKCINKNALWKYVHFEWQNARIHYSAYLHAAGKLQQAATK